MMKNNFTNNYPNFKLIVILSLAISILMQVAMFLSFYWGDTAFLIMEERPRPQFHIDGFILNVAYTFIIALLLYLYCIFVQNKNISDNRKLVYIILGLIINTVILSFIFTTLHPVVLNMMHKNAPPFRFNVHLYRHGLMRDFFVTIIVAFSWELMELNNKRQRILLENERLIAENHITRYEVLKNQINPHFLFNSLNTLQSLIDVDKEKAKDYVQELSKVLRYSLQNQEVVSLEEELSLANSFCKLMEIRYGENLKINFDIDGRMMNDEIIPLSLQVLIENAIKHNVISDKQPLTINISSDYENRKIIVCNKIQSKIDSSTGNGIGLTNLSERYRLKWNYDIEILNNNVEFCVLIKLNKIKI